MNKFLTFVINIIFCITTVFFFINPCIGQTLTITVRDKEKNPLPGAAVRLTELSDSSVVNKITDISGVVVFENIRDGLYEVNITYIGYTPVEQIIVVKPNFRSFIINMESKSIELVEVTITASRPFIRQEEDKMIIDPEPMINISTNTLELLESTPGIYVDPDGGIFLTSTAPATIYINGREQKMSNQDIQTILRSLPPSSVKRIEIIRTPSARYDASASGGIVNIELKKGIKIGRFGSLNTGLNQGICGNRFAGGSLNNSSDKTTQYLSFNYNFNDRFEEINSTRSQKPDTFLIQENTGKSPSHQLYLGYGINYNHTEKIDLSYDGRINADRRKVNTDTKNSLITNQEILTETNNYINNNSVLLTMEQDFGMSFKIDTLGSEWDTKFSYSLTQNKSLQDYTTEFKSPFLYELKGEGENIQKRNFIILQSDIAYLLPLKIKLENGVKTSYQQFSSSSDYFYIINDTTYTDVLRMSTYKYKENISAVYAQFSCPLIAGFHLKSGVRMEHTYMYGNQTKPEDADFITERTDWFPYFYLSRKVIDTMGIELFAYVIYRKTIKRPDYHNLNPYTRIIDEFLHEAGNPALNPQFVENFEVNISYDNFPVFAFGQNYSKDIFSTVHYRSDYNENILVRTYDNLGKNKETYFRGIAGIPPGRKYFFAIGAQYNHNQYNGIYENQPLTFTKGSWRFFCFQSLTLSKNTKLTMSGFMLKNAHWNFYELKPFGMLNIGLTQTFFDKKLTVSLSARDILKTMVNDFEFNQGSVHSTGKRYADTRRFGINIRYNFGIKKKEEKKWLPDIDNGRDLID